MVRAQPAVRAGEALREFWAPPAFQSQPITAGNAEQELLAVCRASESLEGMIYLRLGLSRAPAELLEMLGLQSPGRAVMDRFYHKREPPSR